MNIDIQETLAARETLRKTEQELCSYVKDYLDMNSHNIDVEVSEERLKGNKNGNINFFWIDFKTDNLSIHLYFSKIINDWQYQVNCRELEISGLDPPKGFAFEGKLIVDFICRKDGMYKHKKEVITVKFDVFYPC